MTLSARALIELSWILTLGICLGFGEKNANAGSITKSFDIKGSIVGSGSDEADDEHAKEYSGNYSFLATYVINTNADNSFNPTGSTIKFKETDGKFTFTTLNIPITAVTGDLSKSQVTTLTFSGLWYNDPDTANLITDTGASGTLNFDPKTGNIMKSTFKLTYKDKSSGSQYTYTFTSVPEPSSWAMMLFGIGAAGIAVTRRGTTTVRSR